MIFSPDSCELIVAGKKTVTRRPVRKLKGALSVELIKQAEVPASVTSVRKTGEYLGKTDCRYKVGKTYAVQPGRGKKAMGRILITSVDERKLCDISPTDAIAEGFPPQVPGHPGQLAMFEEKWRSLYGHFIWGQRVWRIEFELVAPLEPYGGGA